jgi:uncharacterized integral membrane protein
MAGRVTSFGAQVRLVFVLLIGIAAIVLAAQNTDAVSTKFLMFEATMPRAVLLLGTAALCFVAGLLVGRFRR